LAALAMQEVKECDLLAEVDRLQRELESSLSKTQSELAISAQKEQAPEPEHTQERAVLLREELIRLPFTALRKRVAAVGGDEAAADEALDGEVNPRLGLVALIVELELAAASRDTDLREELGRFPISELRKKAAAAGVGTDAVDAALDSDSPKLELVALVLWHHAAAAGVPPTEDTAQFAKPHYGGTQSIAPNDALPPSGQDGVLAGKHVMLSYDWSQQDKVTSVRESLEEQRLKVWMDIAGASNVRGAYHGFDRRHGSTGGMKGDIYDSMAEGVEGAAAVVAFMTAQYQSSKNCPGPPGACSARIVLHRSGSSSLWRFRARRLTSQNNGFPGSGPGRQDGAEVQRAVRGSDHTRDGAAGVATVRLAWHLDRRRA
jgi:hypothetical protein